MIDVIDTAFLAQNDAGGMAVFNELALAMTGAGEGALESALREHNADRGGDVPLGQLLKQALQGGASHPSMAALEVLGGLRAVDSGGDEGELATMSFFYSDGGDGGGESDDVDGDGQPDEPIPVTGKRPNDVDEDDDDGGWLPPPGGGGGGDDSGGDGPGGGGLIAEDTPCVEAAPSGVSIQELNNKVLSKSQEIASRNDEMWEYGVIFYLKDGVLHDTGVFGGNSPGEIDWNLGIPMIPNGAIIVGILHNHPDDPNVDDSIPSMNTMQNPGGRDWMVYDQFLDIANRNSRNITTDPNLLMYIYTNEDKKTRVYDKTDKNTTRASCSLEG